MFGEPLEEKFSLLSLFIFLFILIFFSCSQILDHSTHVHRKHMCYRAQKSCEESPPLACSLHERRPQVQYHIFPDQHIPEMDLTESLLTGAELVEEKNQLGSSELFFFIIMVLVRGEEGGETVNQLEEVGELEGPVQAFLVLGRRGRGA